MNMVNNAKDWPKDQTKKALLYYLRLSDTLPVFVLLNKNELKMFECIKNVSSLVFVDNTQFLNNYSRIYQLSLLHPRITVYPIVPRDFAEYKKTMNFAINAQMMNRISVTCRTIWEYLYSALVRILFLYKGIYSSGEKM